MTKTRIKNVVKNVRQAAAAQAAEAATTTLNTAKSMIAKAAKKGVIHRKNASRIVSRLAKLAIRSKA
jgi:small subunit ribosomal protein S20